MKESDEKLDDILKSIKNIIDDRNYTTTPENNSDELPHEDNILELTELLPNNSNSSIEVEEEGFKIKNQNDFSISLETENKTKSAINKLIDYLNKTNFQEKEEPLNLIIDSLIRPLVKEWLNNNLPQIVEQIVNEEIRKIILKR